MLVDSKPMVIEITKYDKARNVCIGNVLMKDEEYPWLEAEIDPFVGCAFPLSDEDYEAGKGEALIGRKFKIKSARLSVKSVLPSSGDFEEVSE